MISMGSCGNRAAWMWAIGSSGRFAGMEVSSSDQSNPGMNREVVSGEAIQLKIKASPGEESIIARASRDAAIEAKDKRAEDRDDARSQRRGPGVQHRRPGPPS